MKFSLLTILALAFELSFSQSAASVGLIVLDGAVDEREWAQAPTFPLQHGGTVSLQHDSEFVYIGIRPVRQGWTHVYVTRGTSVFVLHASAALGTAVYEAGEDRWKLKQQFNWELRDRDLTEEAIRRRNEFLLKRNWVGTVSGMHRTDQEIILRRSAFDGVIAVVHASDAKSPHFWPPKLSDGTLHRDLIFGNAPDSIMFDLSQWETLQ